MMLSLSETKQWISFISSCLKCAFFFLVSVTLARRPIGNYFKELIVLLQFLAFSWIKVSDSPPRNLLPCGADVGCEGCDGLGGPRGSLAEEPGEHDFVRAADGARFPFLIQN